MSTSTTTDERQDSTTTSPSPTSSQLQPKPRPERERYIDGTHESWYKFFRVPEKAEVNAVTERYEADDYNPVHGWPYFVVVLMNWQTRNEGVADVFDDFIKQYSWPEGQHQRIRALANTVKSAFRDSFELIEWLCEENTLTKDPLVREVMWKALCPDAQDQVEREQVHDQPAPPVNSSNLRSDLEYWEAGVRLWNTELKGLLKTLLLVHDRGDGPENEDMRYALIAALQKHAESLDNDLLDSINV